MATTTEVTIEEYQKLVEQSGAQKIADTMLGKWMTLDKAPNNAPHMLLSIELSKMDIDRYKKEGVLWCEAYFIRKEDFDKETASPSGEGLVNQSVILSVTVGSDGHIYLIDDESRDPLELLDEKDYPPFALSADERDMLTIKLGSCFDDGRGRAVVTSCNLDSAQKFGNHAAISAYPLEGGHLDWNQGVLYLREDCMAVPGLLPARGGNMQDGIAQAATNERN